MSFRLTALSTFTPGYLGTTGGRGGRYGAGGGTATIPGTVAARGGGTAATGIPGDNRSYGSLAVVTVNWGQFGLESRPLSVDGSHR